ncbi:hypothetical protein VCE7224_04378 [Vibrio celticus]|uniref:Uncharacterized protein n=2 Tax=Vibrio celticus TaxID=446372 RepID=A0A1C3JKF7_9VIBR|nr:hypothetical protein VCE7224_04378 [Vibrio celticus]
MLIKNLTGRLCEVSDSSLILSNNVVIASYAIQIVYEVRIYAVSGQKRFIQLSKLAINELIQVWQTHIVGANEHQHNA